MLVISYKNLKMKVLLFRHSDPIKILKRILRGVIRIVQDPIKNVKCFELFFLVRFHQEITKILLRYEGDVVAQWFNSV